MKWLAQPLDASARHRLHLAVARVWHKHWPRSRRFTDAAWRALFDRGVLLHLDGR